MADRHEVWYVYGVVTAMPPFAHAPTGLDDASIESVVVADLAAIASRLDGDDYAPVAVERGTSDIEWLAPRAVAHDRVLTWASDRGPVVPFPMFSLFSNEDAVRAMLHERRPELRKALRRASEGREYALRVYRLDDELRTVAADLSPRLAELEDAAAAASPGQRYLIERKLDTERKTELRAIGARVGRDILESLRTLAIDAFGGSLLPRGSAGGGTAETPLVLDAAFLIAPAQLDAFRKELTAIIARHGSRGFRFDFTGPWPPYHFVQSVDRGNGA